MATAAIVVLTPANFYHFRRPKFNFQPLSFNAPQACQILLKWESFPDKDSNLSRAAGAVQLDMHLTFM